MILKLNSDSIKLTQDSLNHLVEKFNLLVEAYTMAVQAQSSNEELMELIMMQRNQHEERAMTYSLQLKHMMQIQDLN